jgi:hypothetical protein
MARGESPQLRNRVRTARARTGRGSDGAGEAPERRAGTQGSRGTASCQPKLIAIRSRTSSVAA